jgi:hypothetical protein
MLRSLMLCAVLGLATQAQAAVGGPCYDRTTCQQIGPDPSPTSAYYNKKCVPDTTSAIGQVGWQNCTKKVDPAEGTGFYPISYPLGTPNEALPSSAKCGDTFIWNPHPIEHIPYWQVQKYYDLQTLQYLPLPCGYYYEAKDCINS